MSSTPRLRPLLMCGPSGSGKSTLVKRMLEEFPDRFGFSVSHTTRRPRDGEVDGVHYHFTDADAMKRDVERGLFLESAVFSGNMYGTSKAAVEHICRQGKVCILDIDVQGVQQVRRTDLRPWGVFVVPPSVEELRRRLEGRRTESPDSLRRRLDHAAAEIEFGTAPGNFDAVIVNDDLDEAYAQLRAFVVDNVLGESGGGDP